MFNLFNYVDFVNHEMDHRSPVSYLKLTRIIVIVNGFYMYTF